MRNEEEIEKLVGEAGDRTDRISSSADKITTIPDRDTPCS
jgi:hypothetical protein